MGSAKYDVICHAPQIGGCGLNCKHCWVTHNLKEHKPLDYVIQMIDGLADLYTEPALAKLVLIYFLDEITLHPDVIEILSYCRKRNVLPQQTIATNGLGFAVRDDWEQILIEMERCGVKGFLMAVNGDEEYHDWFTGQKGSFRNTLKATQRANEFDFKVAWNMYLTSENVSQVTQTARAKGDDRIFFRIPVPTEKWENWSAIHPEIDILKVIPEDCKRYVTQDIKSESDWMKLILSGKITKIPSNPKIANYFECAGSTYEERVFPEFRVDGIDYRNFRKLYSNEPISSESTVLKGFSLTEMARLYGDPTSTRAFTIHGLREKFIHNHCMNQALARQ